MDDRKFDQLAKMLAGAASRRSVLKGSAGAAVAGALALFRGAGARAAANNFVICHKPGTAAEKTMEVASSAVSGHMGHGDRAGACACPVDKVCGTGNELCCVGDQVCQGGTTCGCPAELPELCDSGSGLCGACCSDADCDDGIPCTIDACDRIRGCQHTPDHAACQDDGNVCTDQMCDPQNGGCIAVNNSAACDNGDACTVNDVCIEGVCSPGTPVDCDDGDICTVDSCDPETGCQHAPIPACPGSSASCGPNPDDPTCNCGVALDGSTVCFERFGCAGRPACDDDDGCPEGQACVEAPCCGTATGNICVVPCGERIAPGETCSANAQCANGVCTCGTNNEAGRCHTPFAQNFDADASGWQGVVASGGVGILDANGGEFTRWGGYSSVFPTGGYTTSVDIYLDMAESTGTDRRLDFSSAISTPTCDHRRDFVLSAGTVLGVPGQWAISASNNTPGWPANPNRNPLFVNLSGWYTFKHTFRDAGGVLAVDLSVSGPGGSRTWTLSDPSDIIGVTVGGNRYGQFVTNAFNGLQIDNSWRS